MTTKALTDVRVPFDVSRLPDVVGDATLGISALLLWGDDFADIEDAFSKAKEIARRDGAAILVQCTDNRVVDWDRMPELMRNHVLVATIPALATGVPGIEELRQAVEASLADYVERGQAFPDVEPASAEELARAAERRALLQPMSEDGSGEVLREQRGSLSDDNIR